MADSNIDVASQALARLGEPSISSFSEDSDPAEKVNQLYEPTILGLLSSHPWRFAKVRAELEVDGAKTPVNRWERAFLLPVLQTDRVGNPLAVYASTAVNAPKVFDYELQDRWLLTNFETIVIEYINRKSEQLWPGYFQRLATEALAATLALPITENASKEELHTVKAFGTPAQNGRGGLFATAVEADVTGNPTASLLDNSDPIGAARFGGYR